MKLTRSQQDALRLLADEPRKTSKTGGGGYVAGMTAKALLARGLARVQRAQVDTRSADTIIASLDRERPIEITAEGRSALAACDQASSAPAREADWSDTFCRSVVAASSQYDSTCRGLAAEVLRARTTARRAEVMVSDLVRLLRDVWSAAATCSGFPPAGMGDLPERFLATMRRAPGQVCVEWTDESLVRRKGALCEIQHSTARVVGDDGQEHRFPTTMFVSGALRFVR